MIVGVMLALSSLPAETSWAKYFFRIDWPAGLGALAITVRGTDQFLQVLLYTLVLPLSRLP